MIVGNPENRRIELFQAAQKRRRDRLGRVLSYRDILAKRVKVGDALSPGAVLRIESPGEDFEVERGLLKEGIAEAEEEGVPVLSNHQIANFSFDRGRILNPRQYYLGYRKLLREMAAEIAAVPGIHLMNAPADIEVMFDKHLSHERCLQQGIPVPDAFGPVSCYDELIARMQETRQSKVFLKLRNGSSASGVVAFCRLADHTVAMTSLEIVRNGNGLKLYNSLRVRCYTRTRDQADLINALCREKVHVERWLPKAVLDRHGNLDLRILVIRGEARHWVIRQSRSPLTNLHLGNRRGDREQFLKHVGPQQWKLFQKTCADLMQCFPESLYGGVDLLVMPDLRNHAVLEVNAFGDLLPGVISQGMDTYAAEIEAVVARLRGA